MERPATSLTLSRLLFCDLSFGAFTSCRLGRPPAVRLSVPPRLRKAFAVVSAQTRLTGARRMGRRRGGYGHVCFTDAQKQGNRKRRRLTETEGKGRRERKRASLRIHRSFGSSSPAHPRRRQRLAAARPQPRHTRALGGAEPRALANPANHASRSPPPRVAPP